MPKKLTEIAGYLDDFLQAKRYKKMDRDSGLIFAGRGDVKRIVFAVNTTVENIENANKNGADMLIVHHGGWKETDSDMFPKKMHLLSKYKMSLYVAHMSLDCHKELGVSVSLANKLGVSIEDTFADGNGVLGRLSVPLNEFKKRLSSINRHFKTVGKIEEPKKVAVIGGGGATKTKWLHEAKTKECNVYVTGNSSFFSDIYAFESGIALILLGETNSEKFGIYALSNHVKKTFRDIDILNLEERSW